MKKSPSLLRTQIQKFIKMLEVMKSKAELRKNNLGREEYYRKHDEGVSDAYGFAIIMLQNILSGHAKITDETIELMKKGN